MMVRLAPLLVGAMIFGFGCPTTRRPAVPAPEAADGGGGSEAGTMAGGVSELLGGPTDSEQAARELVVVEANPGEAVVVLHCGFADGWGAAVPLELADEIGDWANCRISGLRGSSSTVKLS